jgi:hypothetical protein
MTDVFDALVGQESAVAAMRQYVKAPVHAYLISGPVGSSLHDTVLDVRGGVAVSPERLRGV